MRWKIIRQSGKPRRPRRVGEDEDTKSPCDSLAGLRDGLGDSALVIVLLLQGRFSQWLHAAGRPARAALHRRLVARIALLRPDCANKDSCAHQPACGRRVYCPGGAIPRLRIGPRIDNTRRRGSIEGIDGISRRAHPGDAGWSARSAPQLPGGYRVSGVADWLAPR